MSILWLDKDTKNRKKITVDSIWNISNRKLHQIIVPLYKIIKGLELLDYTLVDLSYSQFDDNYR